MDILTLILIILIILAIYLFISSSKKNIKTKTVKKEEIINAYFLEMQEVKDKYKDDKINYTKEKIKLLKRINYELSMNIFFEKDEAHKLLEKLSKL